MRRIAVTAPLALLCACTSMSQSEKAVQTRIVDEMRAASTPAAPRVVQAVPAAVSNSLLPPVLPPAGKTEPRQLDKRFDLTLTGASPEQVFMTIVSDTPYSILVSPKFVPPVYTAVGTGAGAQGGAATSRTPETLTLSLKNVTVFEALDAIREMYGYEYTLDGNRIYVQPPELRTKLYHMNYIVGQRRGVSDIQVIAGASNTSSSSGSNTGGGNTAGAGGGTTGNNSGGSYASVQASGLSTIAKSDVWAEVEDAVRTALGCVVPRSVPVRGGGGTGGGGGGGGATGGSSGSSSSSANRADVSFVGDHQSGERMHGNEGCADGRAFVINQVSGSALVRALPRELRQIEGILRSMQISIDRQVIIEAKIIDVELNDGSQQGVNWSALGRGLHRASLGSDPNLIVDGTGSGRRSLGFPTTTVDPTTGASVTSVSPPSLGDLLGSGLLGTTGANAFSAGVGIALQATNFSALINFLETQGRVQVLSSPRIATLNNQKAVLKVGSEEPFVTNITGGSTSSSATTGTLTTPPTLTYQPFFSGISLDVTPQIDEIDNITLHVHSLVNSITEREKIALPTSNVKVPFAVNSVSETDSVVKTRDGQIIVIGGLMTESSNDNRARIPLAGDVPIAGALFGKTARQSTKRELVILLKPTVVKGDEQWSADVAASRARIEGFNPPPVPR
jgi:MSHA biogenesis protein MshL